MPRLVHRPDPDLPAGQRRAAIALIVALHGAAAWGLLQVQAVRESLVAAAPMFVDLLAPPEPEAPPAPPPPPTPKPPPNRPPPPKPVVTVAPQLDQAPTPFVAPAPEPAPAEPVPVAPAPPAPPAPPAAAVPPPPPRTIPPSAIQYAVLPDIVYPSASRRLGEQGLVVVAVYMDTAGVPQQVQVVQSSGFDRLDRAAVAGVRTARFKPYTENGQPLAGWARIPIPFELEN
ncbi:MAG: energy transducer TonB [Burkholderiaceae bacterium]|nr:energy transducer TonB [Burkholderiaceae bacterium]